MRGAGKQTRHATGTPAEWGWGLSRIMATFPESVFSELKIAALKNGRSISAEIRTRIEQSFMEERGTA